MRVRHLAIWIAAVATILFTFSYTATARAQPALDPAFIVVPLLGGTLIPITNPRGSIDPQYGDESGPQGGIVITNFQNANQPMGDRDGWENLQSLLVDSERRIIGVGTSVYNNGCRGELAVARYRSTGVLDPTFGTDGNGTARFFYVNTEFYSTDAIDADVDGDKVVVLTRQIFQYGCACGECPEDIATETNHVVRITSSGAVDPAFGWSPFDFNASNSDYTFGQAISAMPDGSVAACGIHSSAGGSNIALARFTSTGTLDNNFGTAGRWEPDFGGASAFCWDLAAQDDGKLIVAGGLNSPLSLVLIRLLPDGGEDPSFGVDGRVVMPTELGGAKFVALTPNATQPDDDVVVVTQSSLLKFRHDGALDTSFGANGIVERPLALFPGGLAVDPEDHTIFVAGTDVAAGPALRQIFVEAYEPGGALDPTFGGGHVTVQPLPSRAAMTPGDVTAFNRLPNWGTSWWGGGLLAQRGRVVVAGSVDAGVPFQWDFAFVGFRTR
jgi:uncharacterized delta-60 repeat protein